MFLISLAGSVSATYTISTLAAPTLYSLNKSVGGELDANTTYFYTVVAEKSTSYSASSGTWAIYSSLPSTEQNMTTNDTHKTMNLNWTAVAGAGQYVFFRGTESGVYTTHINSPVKITDTNFTDNGSLNPNNWVQYPYIEKAAGQLVISGEGDESNPITLEDIYNNDTANGWNFIEKHNNGVYEIHGYLNIAHSTTLNIKNEVLLVNGRLYLGTNTTVGEKLAGGAYTNGAVIFFKRGTNHFYLYGKIYDTKISSIDDGLQKYTMYFKALRVSTGSELQGSLIEGFRGVYGDSATASFKDLIVSSINSKGYNQFGLANPVSSLIEYDNIIVEGFGTGLQLEYATAGKFKNINLRDNTVDIYLWRISSTPTLLDSSYSKVRGYRSVITEAGNLTIKYSYDLQVLDKDNNPIPNTTINLISYNNATNLTLITNATGQISIQELTEKIFKFPEGATGLHHNYQAPYFDEDMYTPYTLTISKTDYETYTSKFNLTKKTDFKITLESRDWNYSSNLLWKVKNQTGTTILKLDEDGNLAIAGELYENTNTPPPGSDVAFKISNVLWFTKSGYLYLAGLLMELIT